MRKLMMAVTVMAAMATLAACTNLKVDFHSDDPKVADRRALTGFERIELLGAIDVKYEQADSFSVVVEAPADVFELVQTRVDGNRLVVNMKGKDKLLNLGAVNGKDVTVYVTSPDLIGVEVRGSGDFDCKQHLDTDNLEIALKGSGDIDFKDVICDRIRVSLVGSGDVEVDRVQAQQSDVELVGSGDIKMNQRQVSQTRIELKGSGDISMRLDQCGTVDSRLLGSGDITLSGDVDDYRGFTRGSGDMNVKGLAVRKK